MSDGIGAGAFTGSNFAALLARYIGETVTIFTSSGGQSGSGFTGVILSVNNAFVRLLTRIGPPPGCSLGNTCNDFNVNPWSYAGGAPKYGYEYGDEYGGYPMGYGEEYGDGGPILPADKNGSITAGGWNGYPVYTVGSVADIP